MKHFKIFHLLLLLTFSYHASASIKHSDLTEENIEKLNLFFSNNSTKLDRFSNETIAQLKLKLKDKKIKKVTVLGFASKLGDTAYNLSLSKKRAEVVKNEIIKFIDPKVIEIKSFGEESADSTNFHHHIKDRRVKIYVELTSLP